MSPVLQFGSAENVSVPVGYDKHCGRCLDVCASSKGEISEVQTRLGVFAAEAIAPVMSVLTKVLTSPGCGRELGVGGEPETVKDPKMEYCTPCRGAVAKFK